MQFSSETNDLRTRKVFVIIFYFSATIMLSICIFGFYVSVGEYLKTGMVVIGEALANTEFPFPGHTNLVTYLMITSLLSWFCVTKLAGDKMNGTPLLVKVILQIVMLTVAVIAVYTLKIETIRCNVCGQIFDTFESLKEHERSMTEVKKYKNHQGFDAY